MRQFERGMQWRMPRQQALFLSAGAAIVLLLLIFSGVTAAVAAVAAWIALIRHFAQTDADRQRRITESYSKAVEQLSSEKIEVRLGGIYTLERISKESADDYWTVMETLTAFVREHARWKPPKDTSETVARYFGSKDQQSIERGTRAELELAPAELELIKHHDSLFHIRGLLPPTDIAAVLTVIVRRPQTARSHEQEQGRSFDLRGTDLRCAVLNHVHLEGAFLYLVHLESAELKDAHLEGASLYDAHLAGAFLGGAHLERADLRRAHLEDAFLYDAHLEGADLVDAHLEEASLQGADFRGALLIGANLRAALLEGADLRGAHLGGANLFGAQLEGAFLDAAALNEAAGDARTSLPHGIPRPAHWPPYEPPAGLD
jgi:hypothetical protein